jgi:hypothetical protein
MPTVVCFKSGATDKRYEQEQSRTITIDERTIHVQYQKRAHNPLLLAAGFDQTDLRVPWLGRRLRFAFG